MRAAALSLCVIFLFGVSLAQPANLRPIIGVLSQPNDEANPQNGAYIPASYIKYLEQGGARVVPVFYDLPAQEMSALLSSLNGILFTGGGLSLHPDTTYYKTAKLIYDFAVAANQRGDYFPLWGTCQGFQLLTLLTSNDQSLMLRYQFDSENLPLPLVYTSAAPSSRILGGAPSVVFNYLKTGNVTMNLHHDGIDPNSYTNNAALRATYTLLSTNQDRKGKNFGSTIEGIKLPFYATQWHPERNQFEWDLPELLDHSGPAVQCMQYLANFFVNECRRSLHKFPTPAQEEAALIYNYPATFTGNAPDNYPEQQTYYFK